MNKIKEQKGQTILEALVAVAVILIGVLAMVTLSIASVKASSSKQGEISAISFAREGVEAIRNLRDNDWFGESAFAESLIKEDHSGIAAFDFSFSSSPWSFSNSQDKKIYQDQATSFYFQSENVPVGATPSQFSREIIIDLICQNASQLEKIIATGKTCNDPEYTKLIGIRVISRVFWDDQGDQKEVKLEDRLYNWKADAK